MADSGQKTEQPTQRRIHKAREEGQFLSARNFVGALQFLLFLALLGAGGSRWFREIRQSTQGAFSKAFAADITTAGITRLLTDLAWSAFLPLMSTGGALLLFTLAVQLAATR